MFKFFKINQGTSPDDVRAMYRNLALSNHPDRGGSVRVMQDINAEYLQVLESLDGRTFTREVKGEEVEWTYNYRPVTEESILNKMDEILSAKLTGVQVWIIGLWIWVKGDTKPIAKQLGKGGLKLRYHSKRTREEGQGVWYWKPYARKTRYNANLDFDGLKYAYGAARFEREHEEEGVVVGIPLPA